MYNNFYKENLPLTEIWFYYKVTLVIMYHTTFSRVQKLQKLFLNK